MSETENELEQTNQDIESSKPLKLRNQSNFDVDVVIGNLVVCAMDVNHNYNNINGGNLESSSVDVDVDRVTINNVVSGNGNQHADCSLSKPLIDIITAHIEKENGCGYTHPNASEEVSGYVKWDKDTLDFLRENLGVIDVEPIEPTDIPIATTLTLGIVKPDNDTIKINEDGTIYATFTNIDVDKATEDDFGVVKPDGTTITVTDGVISAIIPETNIPIAESDTLGIVMPDNLTITVDETGTISARVPVYDPATTESYGLVKWDEETVEFIKNQLSDFDFTGSVKTATNENLGLVKPDGITITISPDGVLTSVLEVPETPMATETEAGLVKWNEETFELITNNITFPEIEIPETPMASFENAGLVKWDSETFNTISENITFPEIEIPTIPTASTTEQGLVKWDTSTFQLIQDNISFPDVDVPEVNTATTTVAGIVKPDGATITVETDGTIKAVIPEAQKVTVYTGDGVTVFTDTEKNELYTYELSVEGEADSFVSLKIDEASKVYRIVNNDVMFDKISTTVEWSAGVDDRLDELEKIDIATTKEAGLVKPDGTTITITDEGIISANVTVEASDSYSGDDVTIFNNEDKTLSAYALEHIESDAGGLEFIRLEIDENSHIYNIYSNHEAIEAFTNLQEWKEAAETRISDLESEEIEFPTATIDNIGAVKPDGITITINDNGVISAVGGGDVDIDTSSFATVTGNNNFTGNNTFTGTTQVTKQPVNNNDVVPLSFLTSAITANNKDYTTTALLNELLKEYPKKTELASVMEYKGSVNNYTDLTSKTENSTGDVWFVKAPEENKGFYVWSGTIWDNLGGSITVDTSDLASIEYVDERFDNLDLSGVDIDTSSLASLGGDNVFTGENKFQTNPTLEEAKETEDLVENDLITKSNIQPLLDLQPIISNSYPETGEPNTVGRLWVKTSYIKDGDILRQKPSIFICIATSDTESVWYDIHREEILGD